MNSCERPRFRNLVSRLNNLLERDAGYLELSRSLSWKKNIQQKSSATSVLSTALSIEELETVDEVAREMETADCDIQLCTLPGSSPPLPILVEKH